MRITEKTEEELTQKVEFCRPCELENSDVGHKRIEEANFIELQEGYRAIFESANDIFLLIDRKGKIIDVNEKLTEIGGYEREELVGKNIRSLAEITTRKSLAVIVRNFLKRMVGVNVPPYEVEMIRKNGELITLELNGRALRKDGRIIGDLAILRDVTERKQAEQALRESGEIYRSLVNNVRVGVFRSTPGRSGRFLEVNPAIEDITGYSREELLQMNVADLYVHPEERAAVLKEMASGVVKKPRELLFKKKDGTEIVVSDRKVAVRDNAGKVLYFDGFLDDITERKRMEEALKGSEERYRSFVQNFQGIAYLSDINFTPIFFHGAVEAITGYTETDFTSGKPRWDQIIYPDDLPKVHREVEKLFSTPNCSAMGEYRIIRKDGEIRWVKDIIKNVCDSTKRLVLLQGAMYDITERKKMEEQLRIAEQNFRNSLDDSPLGVRIVTAEGELVYANQAILDIYGYSSIEELRNTPLKQCYTPESYAEHLKRRVARRLGQPVPSNYEISIVRKDGEIRHLKIFRKEVNWNGETQFQMLYEDITERKQAEREVRESEERYRALVDVAGKAGEAIAIIQDTEDTQGAIVFVNEQFPTMLGYSREEVLTRPFRDFISADSLRIVEDRYRRRQKGEDIPSRYEVMALRKDGTTVPIDVAAGTMTYRRKVATVAYWRDITESKQSQEKIRQAAEEWRTTFDSITDLVSLVDKDSRIIRVNKAFADVFKKKPKELLGKTCYELVHKTEGPPPDCPHQKTLRTKRPATAEFFEPDLGIHLEETTWPIFNEQGEIVGCVYVARDVTERKRMEEQLIMTDRLVSIGELASGIAHELNNPLTSVIGFSQLLMEGDIPTNIKEDLGLIYSEAQRAAGIVKNLLTFARKHAPVKQLGQINNVIEDVLKLRAYEQKVNNIEVVRRFASDLPEIMVDHFQMQQAFLNIIVNAEYFMIEAHNKGTLTITTKRVDNVIRTSFADDGPGIAKENLGRLFSPFFTTKDVGNGTGLGLSICHGVVTEHGGRIYARSQLGKGATFIVELPINSH